MSKLASMTLPDNVYNWIASHLEGHFHCTKFGGETSDCLRISAGIVQGSSLGPAAYVVDASDLHPLSPNNTSIKFADDTLYLIPESNDDSSNAELSHIALWAGSNNLQLQTAKSVEVIFSKRRAGQPVPSPPLLQGIQRKHSINS